MKIPGPGCAGPGRVPDGPRRVSAARPAGRMAGGQTGGELTPGSSPTTPQVGLGKDFISWINGRSYNNTRGEMTRPDTAGG